MSRPTSGGLLLPSNDANVRLKGKSPEIPLSQHYLTHGTFILQNTGISLYLGKNRLETYI
jgi:hypothetical protein